MNSPRSTRTSENDPEYMGSPRLHSHHHHPHADFVLPSSSSATSDFASSYPPPPPPPRKRVLAAAPLPTASRAKRAIFARDTQASGEEENVERETEGRQRQERSRSSGRQYYERTAKNAATQSLAKLHKPAKKH